MKNYFKILPNVWSNVNCLLLCVATWIVRHFVSVVYHFHTRTMSVSLPISSLSPEIATPEFCVSNTYRTGASTAPLSCRLLAIFRKLGNLAFEAPNRNIENADPPLFKCTRQAENFHFSKSTREYEKRAVVLTIANRMTIDFGFSYREPHRFSNPRAILHNLMLDVSHSLAPALKPPHHRPVGFTLGRFWFGVRSARMYEQVRLTPNSSTLSTVRRVCGIGRAVLTRMPGIPRRSLSGRIMRRRLSFRSLLLAVLKARGSTSFSCWTVILSLTHCTHSEQYLFSL